MKTFFKNAAEFADGIHIVSKLTLKAGLLTAAAIMAGCLVILLVPSRTGELSPSFWCDVFMSLAQRVVILCVMLAFAADFLLGRE